MAKALRLFVTILFISVSSFAQGTDEFLLQKGTVVKLVEGNRARELLMTEDEYTAVLSKFDIQSKTQDTGVASVNDYMKYATAQVVGWTDDEKQIMKELVESVTKKISALGLNIKMPDKIEVIKTTMKEEGGAAGYTRGTYIVLNKDFTSSKTDRFESLFIHELFHVLSRYDKDMREKIYNSLGFKKCNEVSYPPEIADLRISNPDAPHNNFYITVENDGKSVDIMLILFAREPYKGGSFFSYLQIGLLAVEGDDNNKTVIYKDGKPLILKVKEVKNFYKQVGNNTDYIFHADEISADHFVMLLNQETGLPSPELIEAMKNAMK